MELVSHRLTYKPGDVITVMPLGDIQWTGDPNETAIHQLQYAIDYGLKHRAWFVGMGDYIDFMSPSNRQRLSAAGLYDTAQSVIDRAAYDLVQNLYDRFLKPTTGRWLGLLEGHHFTKFEDGTTSDQQLCRLLKTRFLGSCAYVGLMFTEQFKRSQVARGTVNIWCHHGNGGGQSAAAPVQKLETHVYGEWEADIYICGHMTKQAAVPKNRVYPQWYGTPHLQHNKKVLVGSGGFAKAYTEGSKHGQVPRGGYVEQRMLKPVVLGCPVIRVAPRHNHTGSGSMHRRQWSPDITVEV